MGCCMFSNYNYVMHDVHDGRLYVAVVKLRPYLRS